MNTRLKTLLAAGTIAVVASPVIASPVLASGPGYEIVDGGIPAAYTGKPGNADEGRKTIINRKLGNCLACHTISTLPDQPFQGEVGPPLAGVAERYSEPELRLIVTDAKKVFEGTVMPSFYKTSGFIRVRPDLEGKSILTAEQVEDVVAFLKTLQ